MYGNPMNSNTIPKDPLVQDNLVNHRERLGLNLDAFAKILDLGHSGIENLKAMEVGTLAISKSVQKRLQNLPKTINYAPKALEPRDFRFVDLFGGIGGIRLPFQMRGGRCVFTAEHDKHAQITYAANFGEVPLKSGDITQFRAFEIPQHDLLLAGFPCQTFSQAGRGAGFHDTRGTMFFEIQRILAHHRPTAFLLENVKQLKGHDKGRTLETIMSVLSDNRAPKIPSGLPLSPEVRASLSEPLNYIVGYRVLRARDFGVPQNRERIYIVGIQREVAGDYMPADAIEAMFDRIVAKEYPKQRFGEILEPDKSITDAFAISERLWEGHVKRKARHLANGNGFGYSLFDHESEYCNTISARYYKDGSEILVSRGKGQRPRKLTPREAARIQGFPEDFHINSVSTAQAYRQFGNSVAVPVIDAIAAELLPLIGFQTPPEIEDWLRKARSVSKINKGGTE
jgi:DNA (cytosine-5)-methyltransferase 1